MDSSEEEINAEGESKSKAPQISFTKDDAAIQEVREYFDKMACNLRVLGSQLGLEPYELNEIEYQSTSLYDQKQRLVNKCVSKEKLISWEHLADTLEKPALNLGSMAREIRTRHVFSKQYSSDSCSSMNSPTSPPQSASSMEASFSSSMEVDQKFTIPEAVNLIIAVDDGHLLEFGRKLGVDDARLNRLSSYDADERHQRIIEAWFDQAAHEPSRNTLVEALPRRGSSISSMTTFPLTPPTSEPPSDIELRLNDFEIRFSKLQVDTEKELIKLRETVETISATLRALPPRLNQESVFKYVTKLSLNVGKRRLRTLGQLFIKLNRYCWNCFEYELLEFVIKSSECSKDLEDRMDEYAKDVKRFKETTTITMFMKYGRQFYIGKKIPKSHKVVKAKQYINPDEDTLSYLDRVREEIWTTLKLSECILLQMLSIQKGCVEIEWIVPEEYVYNLMAFFCVEIGKKLMERHHVETIYITDVLINNPVTVLFIVAANGKEDLVEKMLDQGADPNAKSNDGKSPLILAAEQGYELVILLLLDREANINFKQEATGRTAVFFAAENGHDVAISILLACGADPCLKDMTDETAYTIAEKKGYQKVCEELQPSESRQQPVVRSDSSQHKIAERLQGFGAALFGRFYETYHQIAMDLIGATKSDDLKTVEYILQQKRDIATNIDARESDKHGWTALMWACDRGNVKIVQLLLDKDADPNTKAKSNEWTPLMLASRKGHLKVVKTLLERGAELNHQNVDGVTSLTISLYEKRTAVAIFLIHKGADINLAEKTGWSPLIRASNEGNLKLVKIIADRGGQLNGQTKHGWSSVMVASNYGYAEVVKELAERGADLTLATKEGDTALHIATLRRRPGVIEELAEQGADLDISNKDGLTALMVATNKGYEDEIEALLEGGADVNYTHEETGWTAIFFAAKNGSVEIVQNLRLHGAKTELNDGTDLIDVASHLKQMSIMDILGTSVDSKPTPQDQRSQNVDHNVRTLETLFGDLETRVKVWSKQLRYV